MNWSHFKPKFAGRPAEDAVAHLLCTNDWMNIHNIPDDLKVGRFCLTVVGETRLWYESLQPIANDWPVLQDTREQLLYAWRSFHYEENVETVDTYVNRIRQVAAMLGCGKPLILEVFKNTVPSKLCWILYPMNYLRVAVQTAKSVDKRKDRQAKNGSIFYKSIHEGKSSKQKEL